MWNETRCPNPAGSSAPDRCAPNSARIPRDLIDGLDDAAEQRAPLGQRARGEDFVEQRNSLSGVRATTFRVLEPGIVAASGWPNAWRKSGSCVCGRWVRVVFGTATAARP
jgi:hypothetical protein